MSTASPPGTWGTVRLLLASARRRNTGRSRRQKELLNSRSEGKAANWSGVGALVAVVIGLVFQGCAAGSLWIAAKAGQRAEVEMHGRMVVSETFLEQVQETDHTTFASPQVRLDSLDEAISEEADRIAHDRDRTSYCPPSAPLAQI